MEKKQRSGCAKVALIVGVIVAIPVGAAILVYFWFRSGAAEDAASEARERAEAASRSARLDAMVLQLGDPPDFPPLEKGDAVSFERYIYGVGAGLATEAGRTHFQEKVDGAPVEWTMRLHNVEESESGATYVATFRGEYQVEEKEEFEDTVRRTPHDLFVSAEFDALKAEPILEVGRNERVTVAGTLSLAGDGMRITDARVVEKE